MNPALRENCENSEEKERLSKSDFGIASNDGPLSEDIFDEAEEDISPVMAFGDDDSLSSERQRRKAFDKKGTKSIESNVETITSLLIKDLIEDLVSSKFTFIL